MMTHMELQIQGEVTDGMTIYASQHDYYVQHKWLRETWDPHLSMNMQQYYDKRLYYS
jgi:hypothetical protein